MADDSIADDIDDEVHERNEDDDVEEEYEVLEEREQARRAPSVHSVAENHYYGDGDDNDAYVDDADPTADQSEHNGRNRQEEEQDGGYDKTYNDNYNDAEEEYDENEEELLVLEQQDEDEDDEFEFDAPRRRQRKTVIVNIDDSDNHIYQSRLCKPIMTAGKTKIGLSKAKLFGLLDQQGQVKLKSGKELTASERAKKLDKMNGMSRPREIHLEDVMVEDQEAPRFRPEKTKEALKAMLNPKCGYDFVDKLNNGETFMDRTFRDNDKQKRHTKAELGQMEADYDSRQDKLQCPGCRKEQSFDQFIEKKRTCTQCNRRFEKLNVSSGQSFERKMKEKERLRLQRLRELEVQMYGADAKSQLVSDRTKEVIRSRVVKVLEEKNCITAGKENTGSGAYPSSEIKADAKLPQHQQQRQEIKSSKPVGAARDAVKSRGRPLSSNRAAQAKTVDPKSQPVMRRQRLNETAPKQLLQELERNLADAGSSDDDEAGGLQATKPSASPKVQKVPNVDEVVQRFAAASTEKERLLAEEAKRYSTSSSHQNKPTVKQRKGAQSPMSRDPKAVRIAEKLERLAL